MKSAERKPRSKAVEILKNTDVKSDILYEIIEELSEWKDLDELDFERLV